MFNVISTREFANMSLFAFIFFYCSIRNPKIYKNLLKIFKMILHPKIFLIFDFFTIYSLLILLCITYKSFWDNYYYKDFCFWIVLCGYPTLFEVIKMNLKDFKHLILKQFMFNTFAEYMTGLITFNIVLEYLICIVCFVFVLLPYCVKDSKKELSSICNSVIMAVSLFLTVMTISKGIINFKDYNQIETIIKLLIPVSFSILSVPFLYIYMLYCRYEELFCIINHLQKRNQVPSNRKRDALLWCGFNIDKIIIFRKLFPSNPYFTIEEFKDVTKGRITIDQLREKWMDD